MKITVFTPAYNRAHLLGRLYDSLCVQTYRDFEWIVVDDGSKDNTEEVVKGFIQEGKIDIRLFKQENGGKHRAINHGVQEAKGELFLILDSDDTIPPDSLELIDNYYQQVIGDASFGGVAGYMAHHDGTIIGKGCDLDVVDTNGIDIRYKYHVTGDMAEVFKTSVLKEFPFPEIEGEKFCPEALVWFRIARKYKLRYFHRVIYYRDYLDGGLTSKIVRIRMQSPIASTTCYLEHTRDDIPFKYRMKAAINYWRFRFCSSTNKFPRHSWKWVWCAPIGYLMHLNDLRKNK